MYGGKGANIVPKFDGDSPPYLTVYGYFYNFAILKIYYKYTYVIIQIK